MNQINNVFGWVNEIKSSNYQEDFDDTSWNNFNQFIINRSLSMNINYIELVNYIQKYQKLTNKDLYKIYKTYLEPTKKFDKYIKSNKKDYNNELLKYISKYYDCSYKETKQYLDILTTTEIKTILQQFGLNDNEIKKIIK